MLLKHYSSELPHKTHFWGRSNCGAMNTINAINTSKTILPIVIHWASTMPSAVSRHKVQKEESWEGWYHCCQQCKTESSCSQVWTTLANYFINMAVVCAKSTMLFCKSFWNDSKASTTLLTATVQITVTQTNIFITVTQIFLKGLHSKNAWLTQLSVTSELFANHRNGRKQS